MCVCVCVRACVCACVHACMRACVCVCGRTHMHAFTQVRVHISTRLHAYTVMPIHPQVCVAHTIVYTLIVMWFYIRGSHRLETICERLHPQKFRSGS